ncbi:hypothetical protein BD779DRAFT_1490145 [Infundibulicybe gibba]|nr:hypothetical protein BD779DRAFT_1490145 [Infundibulicybe gibba]
MSIHAILPRRACVAQILKRHVSSRAPNPQSHRSLPSAKMRALISLYHQSDTFVTPENLSQRIDEAFLPESPTATIHTSVTLKDLENALTDRRTAPRVSEWDMESVGRTLLPGDADIGWSALRAAREMKVIEALYGVDTTNPRAVFPGLEVLEESADSIQENLNDDLEDDRRLSYTDS